MEPGQKVMKQDLIPHNKIGKNNVTLRFPMSTETSQIEILKTDSITLLTYKLSTGSISSWIVILSFRTCPCYCFKLNAKTISKICWSPQFWQPGEKWLPTLIIKYICDKDMYTDTHSLSRIHPHTQRAFFACTNVICCFIHLRAYLSASQVVPPVQMHSSSGWPWAPPPSGTLGPRPLTAHVLPRCYSGLWHHSGRLQHMQYAAVAHGPRGTGTSERKFDELIQTVRSGEGFLLRLYRQRNLPVALGENQCSEKLSHS